MTAIQNPIRNAQNPPKYLDLMAGFYIIVAFQPACFGLIKPQNTIIRRNSDEYPQ